MRNVTRLTGLPLLAAVAFALTGCGGDPAGLGGSNFNPQQTAQAIGSISSQIADSSDVVMSLALVGPALDSSGVTSLVLPRNLSDPRSITQEDRTEAARSFALGRGAGEPIFPSNLLGKTFEWSDGEARYVLNEALTGAPANGVRFLLYAIDPITEQPISPAAVNEIGYLDLTDESSPSSARLGLEAVTGGVTRIDYYIDASYTADQTSVSVTLAAAGFVSDGSALVNFNLAQSILINFEPESATLDVMYTVEAPAEGVVVTLDLTGDYASDDVGSADFLTTISDGTDTVVIDVSFDAVGNISGTISHNGSVAINVSGTGDEPVFTGADGEELTAEQVGALLEIVDVFEQLFEFAEDVFDPFDGEY